MTLTLHNIALEAYQAHRQSGSDMMSLFSNMANDLGPNIKTLTDNSLIYYSRSSNSFSKLIPRNCHYYRARIHSLSTGDQHYRKLSLWVYFMM